MNTNSYLNDRTKARGIRNNNPGNLQKSRVKWQGKVIPSTDSRFEQFQNIHFGLRAMATDLTNDITLKKLDTLTKLTEVYAPRFENDTTSYISQIAIETGLNRNETINLTPELLFKIMKAKIRVENGRDSALISDNDIRSAILDMNPTTAKRIGIDVKKKTG